MLNEKQQLVKCILEQITNAQNDVQTIRTQNLKGEAEACAVVRALFDKLYENLIPIVNIKVDFSENRMFRGKEFKTLREMSCHFDRFKTSEIGYDKTTVIFKYADGMEYTRRYDVCGKDSPFSLHRELLNAVKFHAGLHNPSHMTKEVYESCIDEQSKKHFLAMYYTYQLMAY